MSLLLKALEKSEEGQEKAAEGKAQQGAAPAPAAVGIKLAGGGGLKGSKLGSALAGKDKKAAKKVVAAYDEQSAADVTAEQEELLLASRKAAIRNGVKLGALVVVVAGGWFAFQEFGGMMFPDGDQQQAAVSSSQETAQAAADDVEDAALLPLAEPIYDIQENILAASAATPQARQSGDGDIIKEVESYVERILAEQLRKSRQLANKVTGGLTEVLPDEVTERLSEEIVWAEVAVIDPRSAMLAELERLSSSTYEKDDAFIRKSGGIALESEVAEVAEVAAAGEVAGEKVPTRVVQITKKENGFDKLMEKGVVQYRTGDLDGAEFSFRNILAVEPKNTNALIGLAKIHQSRGDLRLAVATLLKASEYSPNNPIVVSELIAIQGTTSDYSSLPEDRVSELLTLTRNDKVRANLLFLLGNEKAKKKDWGTAKSIFYSAHQLNPGNPDIAYNLAVIYDQLGEQQSALGMYKHALRASLIEASSFEHEVAKGRISELSGNE